MNKLRMQLLAGTNPRTFKALGLTFSQCTISGIFRRLKNPHTRVLLGFMAPRGDFEEEDRVEDEQEEEEVESDDEDLEKPVAVARKDAVYDVAGLLDKLEDISWPSEVGWIHSLSVTLARDGDVNAEDDLAREMSFYTLALEGALEAYGKLQELGVPFLRPNDYYAEMVKSDTHMLKVKDKLLTQKKEIEEEQERRKARESKKFAKQVQAEKLKERAKQKKEDVESVKKWRKLRKDSDFTEGEDEFPVDAGEAPSGVKRKRNVAAPWDRSGGKSGNSSASRGKSSNRGGKGGGFGKNKGRQQRDSKFGHGGRKGLMKKNTADSSSEAPGFKKGRFQKKQRTK